VQGLAQRAVAKFNDSDPATWVVGKPNEVLHGVFIVTGAEAADVDAGIRHHFANHMGSGFHVLETLRGQTRPGTANKGHEHFGFLDGVSQPGIRGCVDRGQTDPLTKTSGADPDQGLPGQDLLWPGEFLFGYPAQNPQAAEFTEKGAVKRPPLPFMVNGAYLVVRRLRQFVPEMHAGVKQQADAKGLSPARVEAQLVGRWPSGARILLSPAADDAANGGDETKNNAFEFDGDRKGEVCPWAAHIRKAYPRNDVPGETQPADDKVDSTEACTQSHRMLRRGIQFGPELTDSEKKNNRTKEQRGLLFKCYVTDIAAQFEFVQQTWVNNPGFSQPGSGVDAIIGQAPGGDDRPFLGAGNPKPTFSFRPWVEMTGGAYFFAPSIDFLRGVR
jgi:Dyp-type peroxidase family